MRVGIANPLCGENVRGIPGACTTHNFTFMARGPYTENKIYYRLHIEFYQQKTCVLRYSNPSDMWLAICRDCYKLAYEVLRRWKKSVSLYRGFNFSSYFWTRSGGWEFDTCSSHGAGTSSPSHWQQVEEQAPKPVGCMMCFLLMTFVPVQKLCVNIYIYIETIYIYALLYEFCFVWFTNCVLLSDDNSLIPGCVWLLTFVLNNTLILGIWCSTIPHLPGYFCSWTFFQNIGFNIVPSDPCMSHLATQPVFSAGELQALQLIVLATFGVVD